MNANKQLKMGAMLSYISIGINILAGLIYTPWMIEQIGKSDYGTYTLANSLITLFLVDFGLGAATSRYLSKYLAEGRRDLANGFLGMVYKLYLIVDAVILLALAVVYFFLDRIYVSLTPMELERFKVVYLIAGLFAVINFPFVNLNGVLTANEKFVQQKFADILQRLLFVGLTTAALLAGMNVYALVMANAVSGLVVIFYRLFAIHRSTDMRADFRYREPGLYRDIFRFSFWTTVYTLAQRLIFNITPTILGIVASSGAIAVFGVVTTIEQNTYLITSAINGMFMPRISRIYASNDKDADILPLMTKVGRFQFWLNGLIVVGFAVLGRSFIGLWMGSDYAEAYLGVLLVILPGLFYNPLQVGHTAMVVRDKVNLQAWIAIVVGVVNVACSFVLSRYYGVIGACAAIFVANSLKAAVYHVVIHKVLKVNMFTFLKKSHLPTLPVQLLTLAAGWGINTLLPDRGWMMLGLKGMLLVGTYLVLTLPTLNKADRKGLLAFVKR